MAKALPLLLLFLSPQAQEAADGSWERLRSMAESQHEIVLLHIKNGEFQQALEVSRGIFDLGFPEGKRHLFVKEGRIIADAFAHNQQYGFAHSVLDSALEAVRSDLSRAALYKEKAYICKKEGKDEQAMELFKRALDLERASP